MRWLSKLAVGAVVVGISWVARGARSDFAGAANALSKHFFVGADLSSPLDDPEFYMRNTVVDVPYGATQDGLFTASYAQPLTRVKWEISEGMLIRSPHVRAHHGQRSQRVAAYEQRAGRAMFAITKHFDVKRAYNDQTGEEKNIIEENDTDRPWFQREYMRVDWSKNLVTDGYESTRCRRSESTAA